MAWTHLTEASSGATRNAGVNGDLSTLLQWALPALGWTIPYSSANAIIAQNANGNLWYFNHDSSVSGDARFCVVRGIESATSISSFSDPFPTVAQLANTGANWGVSTLASTTSRAFHIFGNDTIFYYCTNANGLANTWDLQFAGDAVPAFSGDSFPSVVSSRGTASTSGSQWTLGIGRNAAMALTADNNGIFIKRDVSGASKSTWANFSVSGSGLGSIGTAGAAARAGYANEIYREKVALSCHGTSAIISSSYGALALPRRLYLPNLWSGVHNGNGTVTDADDITDPAYNAAAHFIALAGSSPNWVIIETTDTWSGVPTG